MSNSAPQQPTPFHPTRQQLDDLEALMRRMLALPFPLAESGGHSPPASQVPSMIEEVQQPAASVEEPIALITPPHREAEEAAPTAVATVREEFTAFLPTPSAEVPSPVPIQVTVVEAPSPRGERQRRRGSLAPWLRPLLWSNRVFDRMTAPLGEPGRLLRGARGRSWLGWSGLLFLATAVAWGVLDWMGWL
jgi:hypothetical protein